MQPRGAQLVQRSPAAAAGGQSAMMALRLAGVALVVAALAGACVGLARLCDAPAPAAGTAPHRVVPDQRSSVAPPHLRHAEIRHVVAFVDDL